MDLGIIVTAFVVGVVIMGFVWIVMVWIQKKAREEKKPFVFIFELDTLRLYLKGRLQQYREDFLVPVQGEEKYKRFWGVQTEMSFIIPAYGTKEDIIIKDPNYPSIILVLASVIGEGWQEDSHQKWLSQAFPPDIYQHPPELMEVPEDYVFVVPYGTASQIKSRYGSYRQLFAQMNRMATQYERQLEEVHQGYSKFIVARIQNWNEIMVSGFNSLLEGWNTTKKYTIVPLQVLCRLLHIPLNRVAYSGISRVLQGGGMRQQAQIAAMMRGSLDELNKGFGRVSIEEPLLAATSNKVQELQQRLVRETQEKMLYKQGLDRLQQLVGGSGLPPIQMEPLPTPTVAEVQEET